MADNLMGEQGYSVFGAVDKRGSTAEYVSSARLQLPLPTVPELKGSLVHGQGPNLRSSTVTVPCQSVDFNFFFSSPTSTVQ